MKSKIYIIGGGFSSLSAASYLARDGYQVVVLEKNESLGGRARQLKRQGFTFDIGPTWYWMPDVFERFFADFGKKPSDYYQLNKLSPAYKVYFGPDDSVSIPDNLTEIKAIFEDIEAGSGKILHRFIEKAKDNYEVAIGDLVYRPGENIAELITAKTIMKMRRFFGSIKSDVRKRFTNKKLIQILEFPVLFLGAKPANTPSFYSFMNYADFGLGTWHPKEGMFSVVTAMRQLAESLGVEFRTNANVDRIDVINGAVSGIVVNGEYLTADIVLSGADYAHTEQLLAEKYRVYSDDFWNSRVFAPSCLLFYIGLDIKVRNVNHHTLFFDTDFEAHARDIYDDPKWPEQPLFYASFPSITDASAAPSGQEACILLIPLAPDSKDTPELRAEYYKKVLIRLEKNTRQSLQDHVLFAESFCVNDFKEAYNSFKGNAYGMANTLLQTAFLRPKIKSQKVKNLYFTGQLTVPGPGVPPALISGKLAAGLIQKYSFHESAV